MGLVVEIKGGDSEAVWCDLHQTAFFSMTSERQSAGSMRASTPLLSSVNR